MKTQQLYGGTYDPGSEITVVASASEGLYASISALVHPGDEVIYFEPSFDSYGPIVQLQGANADPDQALAGGFSYRLGRSGCGHHAAHADDHHQLAAQSVRQRVHR